MIQASQAIQMSQTSPTSQANPSGQAARHLRLTDAPAPHIHTSQTTRRLMLDVLLALLPALAAGTWIFGLRVLVVALLCVLGAAAGEQLACWLQRRPSSLADASAAVTGLLLALSLPPSVPLWLAVLGGLLATGVVKGMAGGLGQNAFNPALAARAMLMLISPAGMTIYPALPSDLASYATPLHRMASGSLPSQSLAEMLLGMRSGSIGEVFPPALLLGGAYLIWRGVISVRIPLACLGSAALISLLTSGSKPPLAWMLYSLLGGGLLLGAIFMATDYASSPAMPRAQLIYGVSCGSLSLLLRGSGLYPEGVTYAILIMNACAWALDRACPPRRFGSASRGGGKP